MNKFTESYNKIYQDFDALDKEVRFTKISFEEAKKQMSSVLEEQRLLNSATETLQRVKPLLSKSSIEQCQKLASMAIKAVFNEDYSVVYHSEDGRFYLDKGGFMTDIATSEGGGINSIVSFVFQVYLIIKLKKRRVLFLDEQWSGISTPQLMKFLEFVRQLCHDLDFQCLLITHDARITEDLVDHQFIIEDGISKRVK